MCSVTVCLIKYLYIDRATSPKYCPSLTISDLEPYRSGVRAQAVSKDGKLIHDFLIEETSRSFHVCNAPSPAATSSLPIGKYIVELINKKIRKS